MNDLTEDELTMAQRKQPQQHPHTNPTGWLSRLVDGFEQTERLGHVRCDERLMSAMRARLALPAATPVAPESQSELQH